MSITGFTDIGKGRKALSINHDPTSVGTDAPMGSLLIDANGKVYRKTDDGETTNVICVAMCKYNYAATVAPTVDDDVDLGYSVGSYWYDVTADEAYVCLDATDGAAVWTNITGGVDHVQLLYVGKHGNDLNAGKTAADAFLTFGAAITAAGTPADEANAVGIVCLDDGEYSETIVLINYVNIFAPNASLIGSISSFSLSTSCRVHFRRIKNSGGGHVIVLSGSQTHLTVQADVIESDNGANALFSFTGTGTTHILANIVRKTAAGGQILSFVSDGSDVYVCIGKVEVLGNGQFISATGGSHTLRGFIGEVDAGDYAIYISGTAAIDIKLHISAMVATTVVWITGGTGNVVDLIVGEMTGAETIAANNVYRVTRARRSNLAATAAPTVSDDSTEGYAVGSVWVNVAADVSYICVDASADAAVWQVVDGKVENQVQTTGATTPTIATIPIPDDTAVLIEVSVNAFRTNGADQAAYKKAALVYRRSAGVATLEGAVQDVMTDIESDANFDATIGVDGGNNAIVTVTGVAVKTMEWKSRHTVQEVS